MFARRRSSSLSSLSNDKKFSCINIALLTCCLAVLIGNVTSMSLDRLSATQQARQYQQQNDKQIEFSEFIVPEAESEFLQNDMELVPAVDGQSDMYLLVPAAAAAADGNSQQQTDEQLENDHVEHDDNMENNSDMLMLESDDTPAVQILELPEDVLETKIVDDVQEEQNENHAEEDVQVSASEMDNLAEAVQEIQNEIETELVGQTSEEQAPKKDEQQVIKEDAKEQDTNELPMEHKDNDLEKSFEIENKPASTEDNNSEQEMIGVVMEEPEKINAANPVNEAMDLQAEESEVQPAVMEMNSQTQDQVVNEAMDLQAEESELQPAVMEVNSEAQDQVVNEAMDLQAEESEVQPAVMEMNIETQDQVVNEDMDIEAVESEAQPALMEMNNEIQDQVIEQSENETNEASELSQENEKSEEQPSEASQVVVDNVKPVDDTDAEIEKNENIEQLQDDEVVEDNKTEQEISEAQGPTNEELKADEETKAESSNESHIADEQTDTEDEKPLAAQTQADNVEAEVSSANEIQADDESQAAVEDSEKMSNENQAAVEQQQETETEIVDQTAEEKVEEIQQSEEMQANNEEQPAEETQSDDEVQVESAENTMPINNEANVELKPGQMKPADESVEKLELVAESQIAEEADAADEEIKSADDVEKMQPIVDQHVEETEMVKEEIEPMVENKPVEETQQDDETDAVEDKVQNDEEMSAVVVEENEAVEESHKLEQPQPVEENQADPTGEESEHVESALPLEEAQTEVEEEVQPVKDIEKLENDQPEEEETQPMKDVQSIEDAQPSEDAQLMDDTQPMEETQPLVEDQPMEETQSMDVAQPMEHVQYIEQAKPMDKPILEVQNEEVAEIEAQSIEETKPINEDVEPMAQAEIMNDAEPVEEVKIDEEYQTVEVQPMEDTQNVEETKLEVQDTEITEAYPSQEEVKQEEESQTPEEMQADEDSQDINMDENVTEKAEPIETVTETQSFAEEETQPMDNQAEQQKPEQPALVPEENVAAEENQETAAQIPADELINDDVEIEDKQNEEAKPVVLADENILQNVDTMVEDQKDKQEEIPTVEQQKPLEDKDSDNILNDDTNESEINNETTSMLTTIIQKPTTEELAQQQQPVKFVETTLKPLNVLDSVLNYVNASFMTQMNNENNKNDVIKQDIKEEDEQPFSSKLRRYDGAQVWRIVVQTAREKKLAEELLTKYDAQLWREDKKEEDYLLKPHVLADANHYITAVNLSRTVLIDNLQEAIEVENPPAEEIAQLQHRNGHALTWQAYHRLEDIHSFIEFMAKTYPDICSVETIGYSIEKRPLKILKISNGNANNPGVWIDGGMHAREWISPAVVTFIANQIIEDWENLPAYMRNINWYIHPVANPDGYEYSHTTDRLWRKNMRSHGRACPGVDLNRNFGYKWGGKGTSANPCAQTYRGSKAFSEPESFYISKFISNFPKGTFKAYLSFHSYGQYILYPWGYDYHITKDMADLDLVARQAATIITKNTGVKFTVGNSANTLYPAAGGSDDWAKGIADIKYTYTIEMSDTGRYGFVLPAQYIEPNGKYGLTFVETVANAITMGKNARRRNLKALNKFH